MGVQNGTMAETAYLASTVITGLLGVGVVVLALRARRWHHYTPQGAYGDLSAGGGPPASGLGRIARATSTWTAAYFLVVLTALGGVVAFASGALTGPALVAGLGAVVAFYLVAGVYIAIRENGRSNAQATAGGAITLGLLAILAIVGMLVTA